jgi:hypothetical protein
VSVFGPAHASMAHLGAIEGSQRWLHLRAIIDVLEENLSSFLAAVCRTRSRPQGVWTALKGHNWCCGHHQKRR